MIPISSYPILKHCNRMAMDKNIKSSSCIVQVTQDPLELEHPVLLGRDVLLRGVSACHWVFQHGAGI